MTRRIRDKRAACTATLDQLSPQEIRHVYLRFTERNPSPDLSMSHPQEPHFVPGRQQAVATSRSTPRFGPTRRALLQLYIRIIDSPVFMRTRPWVLANPQPFDNAPYIDALLAQHDYGQEWQLWAVFGLGFQRRTVETATMMWNVYEALIISAAYLLWSAPFGSLRVYNLQYATYKKEDEEDSDPDFTWSHSTWIDWQHELLRIFETWAAVLDKNPRLPFNVGYIDGEQLTEKEWFRNRFAYPTGTATDLTLTLFVEVQKDAVPFSGHIVVVGT
ncbi:hypothetical protein C8R44DRAFT_735710 [Mycena epipterygia]|nr:hypothetical protein C8R44DRAFT_735710 [Mycena epipterygia]